MNDLATENKLVPLENHGIKTMSMGYLLRESTLGSPSEIRLRGGLTYSIENRRQRLAPTTTRRWFGEA